MNTSKPTDLLFDRFSPEDVYFIEEWLQNIDDLCASPAWEGHELYLKSPTICWLVKQIRTTREKEENDQ